MIGTVDVEIQAKNPGMPLWPLRAFVGSPSSIRARNVPKRIGKWNIDGVYLAVAYPDGSVKTAACVQTGGVWTGTVEGTGTSGTSKNGYTVFADGTDENGEPVTGYVLGKGDVEILEADGTLNPDAPCYYVHLLSAQADVPKEGDMFPTDGGYAIWQDGEAHALGTSMEQVSAYVDSVVHGDYIEDASGNKVEANLSYTNATGVWHWHLFYYGVEYVLDGTRKNSHYVPANPQEGDLAWDVTYSDGDGWVIVRKSYSNGQWETAEVYTTIDHMDEELVSLDFGDGSVEWEETFVSGKLATQGYVNSKIGDIDAILDAINGEVI